MFRVCPLCLCVAPRQVNNSLELGVPTDLSESAADNLSTAIDLNQRRECKPCKEQRVVVFFLVVWSTAHDGMSDFRSLTERLGFSFLPVSF